MPTIDQAIRVARAWVQASEHEMKSAAEATGPGHIVALSREAGSRGTLVAREVGRRLDWPVYDNELLTELARELNVDARRLEVVDERPGSRLTEMIAAFAATGDVSEVTYFRGLLKLLLALGARGRCILVGRGATIALPAETTLRVRVVATAEDRIAAIVEERGLPRDEAARLMATTDRERTKFIRSHFHKDLADPLLYDLTLNASRFSVEECAGMVIQGVELLRARPTPA